MGVFISKAENRGFLAKICDPEMSFVSASSPEFIDTENEENEEVSKPLTSLQEILEWEKCVTPFQVESLQMRTEFSVCGSSFHCHSKKSSDWKHLELNTAEVPKTLVCHDMRGGYIEDRYIDGTETPDAYRFFHWAGIDTFVYFSHKLLTIPPPVWITAGHIHGVKVLGTLITEWDEGEKVWNMLLSDEKKRISCVEKMVEICEKFGFDGYLLNVENKLPEHDVPKLVKFVEELQEALHQKLPNAELVWYDSVISNGKLKWQNELNGLNKQFFDACDGMLLNYPWREEQLERSAAEAGPRARAVYAGVDVFGRGSYGGGGFGAAEALRAARRRGLSVALFAPGWTHEALGGGAHFACNEHLFWARLRPHLHVRGPARLPLRTSFCQGFGRRGRACWGRAPACPTARPWYHLGRQRLQPSVASCLHERCTPKPDRPPLPDPDAAQPPPQPQSAPSCGGANRGCVQHYEDDAFDGGGCLQVRRADDEDDGLSLHRLFVCDLKSQSGRLVVVYAVKSVPCNTCDTPCPERRSAELRLALVLRDSPNAEPRMIWVNDCKGLRVQRTSDGSTWEPLDNNNSQTPWQVWEYSVPAREHVVEIIAGLPPGCKAALLGWLEITDAGPEGICDTSAHATEKH